MKAVRSIVIIALICAAFGFSSIGEATSGPQVTFNKDVAPIFYNNCVVCHRAGEIAPMSLVAYKDARPWARSIKEKILSRAMPPWHADPAHGKYSNDRSLSEKDIKTIVSWVDQGATEGNAGDLPRAPEFTDGWQIGKPDLVLQMPQEFTVPAEGVVSYQYFAIPTGFREDRWVQAVEIRPGNRAVVHHVIAFVTGPGAFRRGGLANGEGGLEGLAGTAPGEMPTAYPDGIGKLVKAGSYIVLQMHYTPTGSSQKDRTSIGLIFSRKPVQKAIMGGAAMNRFFAIPPAAENHEVRSAYTFKEDSHILNLMPHMHLRGKDFQYRLIYPDGREKIILSVPRYDFNWQTRYEMAEPVAAPRGSRLECTAHFDNSSKNRWNPDPAKTVRWGQQTWEEMMIGFVGFTLDRQNLLESTMGNRQD